MTFSDGGNVLAVVCTDLTVFIASTRSVLFDSNDPSSGGDGHVFASSRLASLTSLAERAGNSKQSCTLSLFSSTSLFDQLGLDSSRLSLEAPTCCAWWCPAAIVIHRSLKTLQLNVRGSTTASDSDPDTFCDGRYLLIGHASGRLTFFDTSRSTRHIVWSALVDPGRAIWSISLFSDLATLSSLGLWSLPSFTSDRPASKSVRNSDELSLDTLVSGQFPAHIAIPECSLLIQTERNYLRLTLERACSSPFKERRVAAELAQAISSLTDVNEDGVREKLHGVMSSHGGGLPSWVADLPEPKWTETILDVTGVAAVAFLRQREQDSSVLSGDSVGAGSASPARRATSSRGFDTRSTPSEISPESLFARPGTIRFVPIVTDIGADKEIVKPATNNNGVMSMLTFKAGGSQKRFRRRDLVGSVDSRLMSGPNPSHSSSEVRPALPANLRSLPPEFRVTRLAQAPSVCDMAVHVSEKLRRCVITVLYFKREDKLLLFEPSLGDQPLYELLLPLRLPPSLGEFDEIDEIGNEDCHPTTISFPNLQHLKNEESRQSSKVLRVRASLVLYTDSLVFIGENSCVALNESIAGVDTDLLSLNSTSTSASPLSARVLVVSANLAQRAFRDLQSKMNDSTADSSSRRFASEPLYLTSIPADSILECFPLPAGEVIMSMAHLPQWASHSIAVTTSRSVYCLSAVDFLDTPGLIRRMVNTTFVSKIGQSQLLTRFERIERVAFSLGLAASDLFLSLADDLCALAAGCKSNVAQGYADLSTHVRSCLNSQYCVDVLRPLKLSFFDASLTDEATSFFLQAFALFSFSSCPPIRAVLTFLLAGRPDLAVAYAACALGSPFKWPSASNSALASLVAAVSAIPVSSNSPAPADRARLANLLIQSQVRSSYLTPDSFALSTTDFRSWLASDFPYSPERAIFWLAADGFAFEAILVAHSRSQALMQSALEEVARYNVAAVVDSEECLHFVGGRGFCKLLLSVADGAYGNAMGIEEFLVLLTEGQCGEGTRPPQASLSYFSSRAFFSMLIRQLSFLDSRVLQRLVSFLHQIDRAENISLVRVYQREAENEAKMRSFDGAQAQELANPGGEHSKSHPDGERFEGHLDGGHSDGHPGESHEVSVTQHFDSRRQSFSVDRPALAAAQRVSELYLAALLLREAPCGDQCECVGQKCTGAQCVCITAFFREKLRENLGWVRADTLFLRALDYGRACAASFIKAECF